MYGADCGAVSGWSDRRDSALRPHCSAPSATDPDGVFRGFWDCGSAQLVSDGGRTVQWHLTAQARAIEQRGRKSLPQPRRPRPAPVSTRSSPAGAARARPPGAPGSHSAAPTAPRRTAPCGRHRAPAGPWGQAAAGSSWRLRRDLVVDERARARGDVEAQSAALVEPRRRCWRRLPCASEPASMTYCRPPPDLLISQTPRSSPGGSKTSAPALTCDDVCARQDSNLQPLDP